MAAGGSGGGDKTQDVDLPPANDTHQSSTPAASDSASVTGDVSEMQDHNDTDESPSGQGRESSAAVPGIRLRDAAVAIAAAFAGVMVLLS